MPIYRKRHAGNAKNITCVKRQFEASSARPFNAEAYDMIMEEKGKLIDEIERLDEGFTSTYELVREAVQY